MRVIVRRIVQSGVVWLGAIIVANIAYVGWGWSFDQADSPVARPRLSSIGPSLRLLTEIPPEEINRLVEPQSAFLAISSPQSGPVREVVVAEQELELEQRQEQEPIQVVCRAWGPFKNRTELEEVESDIVAAGGTTRVTQSTIRGRSDYLVYIGEPGKAENVYGALEELQSHAIDSALITKGRFNNTLSVGVFSRKDRAQRQRRKVATLGYDAGIEEIDHSYDVFHLEAVVQAGFELTIAPNGPCNAIAQAN